MGSSPVLYSVTRDVATVTFDRAEAQNSFDRAMGEAIVAAMARASADPAVRIVVVAACGKVFSAGGDFNWVLDWPGMSQTEQIAGARLFHRVIQSFADCPKPTIARVQGAAVGGGIGVPLACDFAVAAESARFGVPSVRNGLIAGIAVPFLIQAVGVRKARQLLLRGHVMSAQDALREGLVDVVVAANGLDDAVARLAAELRLGAPGVQAGVKAMVAEAAARKADHALIELLAPDTARLCVGEESQEGMSAFLAKRPARWAT